MTMDIERIDGMDKLLRTFKQLDSFFCPIRAEGSFEFFFRNFSTVNLKVK